MKLAWLLVCFILVSDPANSAFIVNVAQIVTVRQLDGHVILVTLRGEAEVTQPFQQVIKEINSCTDTQLVTQ